MPFNLIPSPKSVLGLATSVKALVLRMVRGHSEEKSGTQLNQVMNVRGRNPSQWFHLCIPAFDHVES